MADFGLSVILKLVDKLSGPLSNVSAQFARAGREWERNGKHLRQIGRDMSLRVTAPIIALGGLAAKAAVDFESAFTGVVKTVDASATELEKLRTGFLQMAKEIPLSTEELYKIGEAAGQLGIKTENILSFSKTMADLGATTNLSADEAATQLARFANITGMSQKEFDRLGSTIVALGNNTATTEAEIVSMAMRLAGAGKQVGLTNDSVMSLAATLSSVGLEAEAGGTAFSRVMIEMNKAVAKGSKELGVFDAVAKKGGLTGNFAQAFKKDAIGSLQKFIEGMKTLSDNGVNVSLILDAIGLDGIRVADSLMRASGAGKLLNDTLKIGSDAWEQNTALTREAELRYKTAASQFKVFMNELKQLAASFGEVILPILIKIMRIVRPMVEAFTKLPKPVKEFIVIFAGIVALIGPLLAFAGIIKGVIAFLGVAAGPILAIAAAIAGVSAAISQLITHWQTLTSGGFFSFMKDLAGWTGELIGDAGAYWGGGGASAVAARQMAREQSVNVNNTNQSEVTVRVESGEGVRARVKDVKSNGNKTLAFASSYAGPMMPAGGY